MLILFLKILLFKLSKKIGFPNIKPINYTISITYRCNSKCKTCNITQRKADDLSVEEYKKIFSSIGKSPYWVTISGGEPFLRNDLVEICQVIYKYSKPKIINIPTNGILVKNVVEFTEKISKTCPKSNIVINLSIDNVGDKHDYIRGVKGNYTRVMECFKRLNELNLPNLTIGIHTVISRFNIDDFTNIMNTFLSFHPDSYITEIAEQRVELKTEHSNIVPNLIDYSNAMDLLIHRIKHSHFKGLSRITEAFRIEYYQLVKRILREKTQIIPCYAGYVSVQIAPDGDVWPCCIKAKSVGNLRDFHYNFKKLWRNNPVLKEERNRINNKKCYCPMANASYTNMLMNFKTLFRVAYRSFVKWYV